MNQHSLTIRLARVEDAQAIAELHIRSWQWAYRGLIEDEYLDGLPVQLEARIERRRELLAALPPETRWWLVEQAGRMVGFATTGLSRDSDVIEGTAEVYAIYLAPEAAGRGIGRALFAHAVEDLRQRGYKLARLWVLASNQRARAFYERAGWLPDGASKVDKERSGIILHEVRYALVLE